MKTSEELSSRENLKALVLRDVQVVKMALTLLVLSAEVPTLEPEGKDTTLRRTHTLIPTQLNLLIMNVLNCSSPSRLLSRKIVIIQRVQEPWNSQMKRNQLIDCLTPMSKNTMYLRVAQTRSQWEKVASLTNVNIYHRSWQFVICSITTKRKKKTYLLDPK